MNSEKLINPPFLINPNPSTERGLKELYSIQILKDFDRI